MPAIGWPDIFFAAKGALSMSLGIKVVKGMKDIPPNEIPAWYFLEEKLKSLALRYGYQEIRLPLLEQTELFKRSIGEVTDIVEKEMYTFQDRGGDSLTLRPEGTAQVVRAILENSLIRNQSLRLWYYGAMFRRENPQKGRYRQFHQFGVEAFGLSGPDVDVEQILMMDRLWTELGLRDKIVLQLNSLGTSEERQAYTQALQAYLWPQCEALIKKHSAQPDLIEKIKAAFARIESNPLRVLDSKEPLIQEVIRQAPVLLDYLGAESLHYFETTQRMLKEAGVPFEINPRLVRGIDYYTHTVYEWVTTTLGAQGTVCAGGRFDDLVQQIGGPQTPSIGFALGVERILMLLKENQLIPEQNFVDVYFVAQGELAQTQSFIWAEKIRSALPALRLQVNCGGGNFKSQFKRADKSGARFALILGEDEAKQNVISIKALREENVQYTKSFNEAIAFLQEQFAKESAVFELNL